MDLTSSRNIFVIGLSLYLGLAVPSWTNAELAKEENVSFMEARCLKSMLFSPTPLNDSLTASDRVTDFSIFLLLQSLQTGNEEFDTLLAVVLSSGMIVGGTIACFLDNTLPGTDEERGKLLEAQQIIIDSRVVCVFCREGGARHVLSHYDW